MVKVETCFVVILVATRKCIGLVGHVTVLKLVAPTLQARECVFLLREKMEETYQKSHASDDAVAKQAKTDLQKFLSQHSIQLLATNLLLFGGDKHGIFSAQPGDLMHGFLEGIVKKYAVRAF
jgi:hypothetical protein